MDDRTEDRSEASWEEFEEWIRSTIGSDFRWCVRPRDTPSNRHMIARLVLGDKERNGDRFPDGNAFIERV
jgi:hypothetical protein